MSISRTKPVYLCFGCKASGHLSYLLRSAGLSRQIIETLLPKTVRYDKVAHSLGAKILRDRNVFRGKFILEEEILDNYRLAPTALLRAGFHKNTLRHFEVGYDTTNIRITYPLRNIYGELVGISGRAAMEGIEPRYKGYDRELRLRTDYKIPEDYSLESVKSAVLWHGHVVRPLYFSEGYGNHTLVITEGFKACMWTWQAGFEDVVALVGSYLTDHHAELISRVVRQVLLFLDNNEAGWNGTKLAATKLTQRGVEVLVPRYPDEREQPDDLQYEEIEEAFTRPLTLRQWSREHPIRITNKALLRRYGVRQLGQ
jgi:DNA primase